MTKKKIGIADLYILTMLTLFPLYTGFRGYRDITRAKLVFFLAATALALIAQFVEDVRAHRRSRLSLPIWLLAAYMAWSCVSALCSPYGSSVYLGAGRYDGLVTLLFYGAAAYLASRGTMERVWYVRAFAVSVTLCCLVAVIQIAGGNPLGLYPHGWRFADAGIEYAGMFLGTVGNTLVLASVLTAAVPLFALTAIRRKKQDFLLLVPAVLAAFVLIVSESSSSAVALLGACALLLPTALPKKAVAWGYAAESALLLGALAVIYLCPKLPGTLGEISALLHGEALPSFGSSRFAIWREALSVFPERPILGGGPGTTALRIEADFSRVTESGKQLAVYTDNAHNEYLTRLIELGIPGLALYLAAMLTTVLKAPKTAPIWERRHWLCALLALWIQAFFGLGLCLSAPVLWTVWGVCMRKEDSFAEVEEPIR